MRIRIEQEGKIVKNNVTALGNSLKMQQVTHQGNFVFTGYYGNAVATVYTVPVDEDAEKIRILSVITKSVGQTLAITYRLFSREDCAEGYIELPVTSRNYEILTGDNPADYLQKEHIKLWIYMILNGLVKLQGYEDLEHYTTELKQQAQ